MEYSAINIFRYHTLAAPRAAIVLRGCTSLYRMSYVLQTSLCLQNLRPTQSSLLINNIVQLSTINYKLRYFSQFSNLKEFNLREQNTKFYTLLDFLERVVF